MYRLFAVSLLLLGLFLAMIGFGLAEAAAPSGTELLVGARDDRARTLAQAGIALGLLGGLALLLDRPG